MEEKMKKIVFWISVMLFAHVMPMAQGTIEKIHAGARGCCMQRATTTSPWYPNGMGFNQCRSANQYQDANDDLYQASGLIRWNVNC
jgi:hypothetical protein